MKFVVRVTETLSKTVIVYANDATDAHDKVEKAYDNEDIVLDYRDYHGYEIDTVRVACPGDIEMFEELEVEE